MSSDTVCLLCMRACGEGGYSGGGRDSPKNKTHAHAGLHSASAFKSSVTERKIREREREIERMASNMKQSNSKRLR